MVQNLDSGLDWKMDQNLDWMMDSIEKGFMLLWVPVLAAELSRKAQSGFTTTRLLDVPYSKKVRFAPIILLFHNTTVTFPLSFPGSLNNYAESLDISTLALSGLSRGRGRNGGRHKRQRTREWCFTPRQLQHSASTDSSIILCWRVHNCQFASARTRYCTNLLSSYSHTPSRHVAMKPSERAQQPEELTIIIFLHSLSSPSSSPFSSPVQSPGFVPSLESCRDKQ